jgi:hypothetical protein
MALPPAEDTTPAQKPADTTKPTNGKKPTPANQAPETWGQVASANGNGRPVTMLGPRYPTVFDV